MTLWFHSKYTCENCASSLFLQANQFQGLTLLKTSLIYRVVAIGNETLLCKYYINTVALIQHEINCSYIRTLKWDTMHSCCLRGSKTAEVEVGGLKKKWGVWDRVLLCSNPNQSKDFHFFGLQLWPLIGLKPFKLQRYSESLLKIQTKKGLILT